MQTAWHQAFRVWFGITVAGVVSSAIVLFAMEIHCRKIRPLFFPHGGLRDTPGVIFLNLRQRTLITFGLTGILPMILIGTLCYYQIKSTQNYLPEQLLQNLFYLICFLSGFGLLAIITLSHLFAVSIIDPIQTIEAGMNRVEAGDLNVSVPVYSCDEFGAMMENFTKMVTVLKERYRMKQALDMAMDVQQNLLPKSFPALEGIDMAAICTTCDEIGGDYYDVISSEPFGPRIRFLRWGMCPIMGFHRRC
jgi:HAMP domain-containing protein